MSGRLKLFSGVEGSPGGGLYLREDLARALFVDSEWSYIGIPCYTNVPLGVQLTLYIES